MSEETDQERQDREDREYINSNHKRIDAGTGKWKDKEKAYMRTYHQERYKREKEENLSKVRSNELKKRYGIDMQDKIKMAEKQEYRCAVCRERFELDKLEVDHDKYNGIVRELLCHTCNLAVGFVKDDPARAEALARYLRDYYKRI